MKRKEYVGHIHVGAEAICIDGVTFRYPDGTLALENIDLHVSTGSTLAIIGPNGAGKTTLLKLVLGALEGCEGKIEVAGMSPVDARGQGNVIGWVPQRNNVNWDFPVSVRQVVEMGLAGKTGMFKRTPREDIQFVDKLMDIMGLASIAKRPIGDVSGGQQQRAIIARALAPRPDILLLDEPMVGVDESGQQHFQNMLHSIKDEFDLTLVIVSHDLRSVLPTCQRIACLNRTLHFHDAPGRLDKDILGRCFQCSVEGLVLSEIHGEKEDSCAVTSGPEGGDDD